MSTTSSSRVSALLFIVALVPFASSAWAQTEPERPDDNTAEVEEQRQAARASALRAGEEAEATAPGAEKDDPTYRRDWQRKAWGVTTPTFRSHAIRVGQDHSNRKHARG